MKRYGLQPSLLPEGETLTTMYDKVHDRLENLLKEILF